MPTHDPPFHEIRAQTGFFPVTVTCRLDEDGLRILRGGAVTRIGHDAYGDIRFHRRGSGRAALVLAPSDGRGLTLLFKPALASDDEIADFVADLGRRIARSSPVARLVIGPSRRQWVASWIGVLASGVVLAGAALSLWGGVGFDAVLVPSAVALINLGIVVPIVRAGPPRALAIRDAAAAIGGSAAAGPPGAP